MCARLQAFPPIWRQLRVSPAGGNECIQTFSAGEGRVSSREFSSRKVGYSSTALVMRNEAHLSSSGKAARDRAGFSNEESSTVPQKVDDIALFTGLPSLRTVNLPSSAPVHSPAAWTALA